MADDLIYCPDLIKFSKKWRKFNKDTLITGCSLQVDNVNIRHQDTLQPYFVLIKKRKLTPIGLYRKLLSGEIVAYKELKEHRMFYGKVIGNIKNYVQYNKQECEFMGKDFKLHKLLWNLRYIDLKQLPRGITI